VWVLGSHFRFQKDSSCVGLRVTF